MAIAEFLVFLAVVAFVIDWHQSNEHRSDPDRVPNEWERELARARMEGIVREYKRDIRSHPESDL